MRVRDKQGRTLFFLEGDDAIPRDENGKPIAQRVRDHKDTPTLSRLAAKWMRPTLLDLGVTDILKPGTEAEFSIPKQRYEYVADEVAPIKYVKHAIGTYFLENVNDSIELVMANVNASGQTAVALPGYTSNTFTTQGYAIAAKIPNEVLKNADFDIKKRTLRRLTDALLRSREVRVSAKLTTAANYAAGNQIAVSARWNGGGAATPLLDLFAGLQASFLPADTLILPEIAAPYFYANNDPSNTNNNLSIREYVQANGPLPRILLARSKQMVAGVPGYVWMPTGTGNIALVRTTVHDESWKHYKKSQHEDPVADWEPNDVDSDIGTAVTFRWLGDDGQDGERVDGVLVREFEDKSGHAGSIILMVTVNDAEAQLSNQIGACLVGAMA